MTVHGPLKWQKRAEKKDGAVGNRIQGHLIPIPLVVNGNTRVYPSNRR